MKPSILALVLIGFVMLTHGAGAQSSPQVEFDKVLADYQQVPATINPKRIVVADRLEVRTRPIPEAAVLDVLRPGDMVGLVSEGGGWATIDLGGGFLGWMRSDGLKTAPETVKKATPKALPPIPAPRIARPTLKPLVSNPPAPRRVYF